MADYYVDGSAATNGDGSIGSPWDNLNSAIDSALTPGNTIKVRGLDDGDEQITYNGGDGSGGVLDFYESVHGGHDYILEGYDGTPVITSTSTANGTITISSNVVSAGSITFKNVELDWTGTGTNAYQLIKNEGKFSLSFDSDCTLNAPAVNRNIIEATAGTGVDIALDGCAVAMGMYLVKAKTGGCGDVSVTNCFLTGDSNMRDLVYVESGVCGNVTNTGNTCTAAADSMGRLFAMAAESAVTALGKVVVGNNICVNFFGGVRVLSYSDYVCVYNNTISLNRSAGLDNVFYFGEETTDGGNLTNDNPLGRVVCVDNDVTYLSGIAHNILLGRGADGAYVAGNRFNGGDFGIVIKANYCTVCHNVVDGTTMGGIYVTGGAFANVFNNTVIADEGAALLFDHHQQSDTTGEYPYFARVYNNVLVGTGSAVAAKTGTGSLHWNIYMDYNCLYTDGSALVSLNGLNCSSLAAVQAEWQDDDWPDSDTNINAAFNDQHSIHVDPDLAATTYLPGNRLLAISGRPDHNGESTPMGAAAFPFRPHVPKPDIAIGSPITGAF